MPERKLPRVAYVLLWFPKPSETFIFREVKNLLEMGLPLHVHTLYGSLRKNLSPEMEAYPGQVHRLGLRRTMILPVFVAYWFLRSPLRTGRLFAHVVLRRWKGLEKSAENAWAILCAFYLAYRFAEDGIEHIHAPWACGCATAAWLASALTGIPFSFTIRAWDIYPPDSLIGEKVRDAVCIRSETLYNIEYLKGLTGCPATKFELTYNGVPIASADTRTVALSPPYQLLAVGRLVGKKGFVYLLHACAMLRERSVAFHLHLVGNGPHLRRLKSLCRSLSLDRHVTFHGFQRYEKIPDFFKAADICIMPCIIDGSGDRDGIPTVILESLLHSVPVITTPVSGIPELIEEGVTGSMVPQKDPAAIARAILALVSDREAAHRMARNGNRKVREVFNAEANHRRVLSLYERHAGPAGSV